MTHKILKKTTVYRAHAFNVETLHVKLPDDRERDYNLIRHNDSVTILPLDQDNNVLFVTQYRMGSENIMIELPAGVMDDGENPLECAKREIREETGMAAEKLEHLGSVYLAAGYSSEINHIFLATDLYKSPLDQDDDEFLGLEKIPVGELGDLAKSGRLQDSKTMAALYLAAERLPS